MIERLVRHRETRGQFRFASEAKAIVPPRPEYLLAKSHRGLHVLGPSEHALVLPLRLLRAKYGGAVSIEPSSTEPEERGMPTMEVRIGLENRYVREMVRALRRRGVNASEEYVGVHHCVLRFDALLPDLLGLPGELAELTEGKATHEIVLSRYE